MKSLLASLWIMSCWLLPSGSHTPSKSGEGSDAAQIRNLRAQSNRAVQARDLVAYGQSMLPDVEVTRGSGTHLSGRGSVLASVASNFQDASFLGYVRDPDNVQVNTSGTLAAEHGHWTSRFQRSDGIQTFTGVYLAMWKKTESGWKIRSELFVSLGCTGSAACGK